jgi:pimeloyl-ACP methyl ester carboxylesterase
VLVDASGPAFTPQEIPPGFRFARLPLINRLGEHLLPRSMVRASVHSVYGDPSRVSEAVVDRYFEITLREGNRRALNERLRLLPEDLQPQKIAAVAQPTLILWGEHDRLIPPSTARAFEQAIAGSRAVVLPGLGHVPQEEDPVASLAAAREFLGLK